MQPIQNIRITSFEQLKTFIQTFHQVLEIIGYDEKSADKYLQKFMIMVELKVLERIERRIPNFARANLTEALENLIKDSKLSQIDKATKGSQYIQEAVKSHLSPQEVEILYLETVEGLFEEYIRTVSDAASEVQRVQIYTILEDGFNR